jgi:hypothetical protein
MIRGLLSTTILSMLAAIVWCYQVFVFAISNDQHKYDYVPKRQIMRQWPCPLSLIWTILDHTSSFVIDGINKLMHMFLTYSHNPVLHQYHRRQRKPRRSVGKGAKCLLLALAHASTTHPHKPAPYIHAFDTDSVLIRIDNCASCSMSMDRNDFVGPLIKSNLGVKGISGTMRNVSVGTIRWVIHNDEGMAHTVMLPNSLYVPNITS